MIPIVPAIIPTSAAHLVNSLAHLGFSPEVHVDVVDGLFVESVSWPYLPSGKPTDTKLVTDGFTLEVDLMVESPLTAADAWLAAGADMIVFHTETISLEAFTRYVASSKITIGICANNDTSQDILFSYLEVADYVQVMGIATIGSQGQPLDARVFDRIAAIKETFPNKPISIDGSVNKETIARLAKAGPSRFICGSAVVGQASPQAAHTELLSLIN